MKTLLQRLVIGAVLLAALVASTSGAGRLHGPEIMRKVTEAYAALSSYQDSGVVYTHDPNKDRPDQILFRTYFARPEKFRFEWTTHHPYPPLRHKTNDWVVWTDTAGAHLLGLGKQQDGPLAHAVAGATGVSRGSVRHIPRLLLGAIPGFSLADLADVRLVKEESVEGTPCYHLRGNAARGSYELWVGKTDYLVRRLQHEILGKPVEEIHREIQTNHEIGVITFERKPK